MSPATSLPGLIGIAEAAAYLGCRPRTLYKLLARSRLRLKGVPVDGPTSEFFQAKSRSPVRFRREWLDRYITLGAHRPEDAPLLTGVAGDLLHRHQVRELVAIQRSSEVVYYPQISQILADSSTCRMNLR